jgi:hypothetical protein
MDLESLAVGAESFLRRCYRVSGSDFLYALASCPV